MAKPGIPVLMYHALIAALTFSSVNTAYAYYSMEHPTEDTIIRTNLPKEQANNTTSQYFYLVGNQDMQVKKQFLSRSEAIIPADYLPFDAPLHNILSRQQPSEISLANLLYANLRLAKLLEEYAQLQKNARSLITDIKNSPLSNNNLTQANIPTSPITLPPGATNPPSQTSPSIFKDWEKLKKESSTLGNTLAKSSNQNTARSNISLGPTLAHIQPNATNTINDFKTQQTTQVPDTFGFQKPGHSTYATQTSEEEAPNKTRRFDIDESSRPRIDRYILKIFRYFVANKLEATLLLILSILLLGFLSAILQK